MEPEANTADRRRTAVDCSSMVRDRVHRACQNPFFSRFREEATRQTNRVQECAVKGASAGRAAPSILQDGSGMLHFPFRNGDSTRRSADATASTRECVTLIGGTGFFGKFVAEQYLHRGISVTVLARDVDKARNIFLPIADGERERRTQESRGFLPLRSAVASRPVPLGETSYADSRRNGRRVLRYEYSIGLPAPTEIDGPGLDSSRHPSVESQRRCVTLELVEGDANAQEDVEFAVRHAAVVYYLVPALCGASTPGRRWWLWGRRGERGCAASAGEHGFLTALEMCRRVDAHFVALTPLWTRTSFFSPTSLYRRLFTHPRGYVRAVHNEERALLESRGTPSARCYFGDEYGTHTPRPSAWWYWWTILRSTRLPEDEVRTPCSPVRFSLFRLSDIVYPAFNERVTVARNNCLDSALCVHSVKGGDLDARLLASVLAKTLSLCTSVVESRIDVGGALRGETDMRDTAAVLKLFSSFATD